MLRSKFAITTERESVFLWDLPGQRLSQGRKFDPAQ